MEKEETYIKGRGAQINTPNRFHEEINERDPRAALESDESLKTSYIPVHPKTIVNKIPSPDIPADFGINPYQGCEHGCIYCYARNTHSFWGYSAGTDFETKILVKYEAPELLRKKLQSKNWKAAPILLSGNTDCYQPIEKQTQITRKMLEILWNFRHPVSIITKNSLIERDIDILSKMAKLNLVKVNISLTSLKENLLQRMEPRTSSALKRLRTIENLSTAGIPVHVMMAPIIPGLTDSEIFDLVKEVAKRGARSASYQLVRLNGDVAEIFTDWVTKNFPNRAEKILIQIKSAHGGSLNDSRFGARHSGEGEYAKIIRAQFKLAKKKYFCVTATPDYNLDLYEQFKNPQMTLF